MAKAKRSEIVERLKSLDEEERKEFQEAYKEAFGLPESDDDLKATVVAMQGQIKQLQEALKSAVGSDKSKGIMARIFG